MPTFEEFIAKLPVNEARLTKRLRKIVLDVLPGVEERFIYGVPHYCGNARICFIWPRGTSEGKINKGVAFGFCKGYLMTSEHSTLKRLDKTQIATIFYPTLKDIDEEVLMGLLAEAVMIDERSMMTGHLKNQSTLRKKARK